MLAAPLLLTFIYFILRVGPLWHAGHVHLLALNSEVNMSRGSDQWNFAVADLAAVDRTKTPFVVMQWHRLMYSAADPSSSDWVWGNQVREQRRCVYECSGGVWFGPQFQQSLRTG